MDLLLSFVDSWHSQLAYSLPDLLHTCLCEVDVCLIHGWQHIRCCDRMSLNSGFNIWLVFSPYVLGFSFNSSLVAH